MLRRRFVALFAGFCAVIAAVIAGLGRVGWARPRQQAPHPVRPEDMDSAGILDFLLKDSRFYPQMPAGIEAVVKDRFSRAETDYQRGRRPGVREQSVADAFNTLASALEVPDYAFTSQHQVRVVRMSQALTFPKFMQIDEISESVPPEMSPIQTAWVMKSLIELKLVAQDYQVPPAEWDQTSYEPALQNLERSQQARKRVAELRNQGARLEYKGKLVASKPRPTKYKELYDILSQRVSLLTPSDGVDLLNRTLATLGI